MSLALTTSQAAQILSTDTLMDTAMTAGVTDPTPTLIVQPMTGYTTLTGAQKIEVRQIFNDALAAFLSAGAGITTVVSLTKVTPGGANGSMTFVNGILTATVAPT